MTHHLDDDAVAGLPISGGRAELLEEIMSIPVDDRAPATTTDDSRRAQRWAVPLGAAAAVALLAAGPLWWAGGPGGNGGVPTGAAAPGTDQGTPPDVYGAVLDADGWRVEHTGTLDGARGDVAYVSDTREITGADRASLELTWYQADLYDGYVEDREHIVTPSAPGEPVEVVGRSGQLWPYNRTDHTVIAEVVDGWWFEVRGSGMNEADYLDLLGDLRLVDETTFEATLPEGYVTRAERDAAVAAILHGIGSSTDPVLPPGDTGAVRTAQSDPYNVGADVAGTVACRWLGAYERARTSGDDAAQAAAADTLATTRDWPVLQDLAVEGDYAEVVWEISDDAVAGRSVEGYEGALGC